MARIAWTLAAVFGFLAVALGAFGAHGLDKWLTDQPDAVKRLANWNTGVRYQMWHALVLLGLAIGANWAATSTKIAMGGFVLGIVLFSGSLYAYTLTNIKVFGAITPLGGLAMLVGWAAMLKAFMPR